MSVDRWNTVLVLGGTRSGKSAYAESLVAQAPSVRYVATAIRDEHDQEWAGRIDTHRRRRPQSWSTEETGADPARLAEVLAEAKPDDTLLIDDLGGWVSTLLDPAYTPAADLVAALAQAVRECPARIVVVSPEVGLSVVAPTPVGRTFADLLGTANQAVAAACDQVILVVAGQPLRLKSDRLPARTPPAAVPLPTGVDVPDDVADVDIPLPDSDAGPDARDRLDTLDFAGAGIGTLGEAVEFAAATQHTAVPRAWQSVRLVLLRGQHAGGAAAGTDPDEAERRLAELAAGEGVLAQLASDCGADVAVVVTADADAMEDGPATDTATVDAALAQGRLLAAQAADEGRDVLVLGSCGTGTDAAAAAVLAAMTSVEAVAILPRVRRPGGRFDDEAWMRRTAAIRDALYRSRTATRDARGILVELGGPDLAVAVGVLLGAAARRLPVLLDGPVGIAAALVARDLAGQLRHWCLLAEAGTHRLVEQGADMLGINAVLRLGLDLGEGTNALAVLPLIRTMTGLAGSLPAHPTLSSPAVPAPADSEDE